LAKALQLAAQTFSTATVTAAGAQARLLTPAGLTAICIAHSIHSKDSAEAVPLLKQTFDGSCTLMTRVHPMKFHFGSSCRVQDQLSKDPKPKSLSPGSTQLDSLTRSLSATIQCRTFRWLSTDLREAAKPSTDVKSNVSLKERVVRTKRA